MQERERRIYRITLTGTVVNMVLVVLKFVAGIFGRSSALIADAVHSLSDFVSDIVVLIFVRIAGKPRDENHDYGHGKFETLATLIIGLLLALAGVGLLIEGVETVIRCVHGEILPRPAMIALVIALLSILSKEWLYHYTVRGGRELGSQVVIANAWHHRSDAISSVGTLIGVAGAMFMGERWRILDPIAAIVVSMLIVKSAYDIIRPAINELLEASLPREQEDEIRRLVTSVPGILDAHNLRTRRVGNGIVVDLHARMDGGQSLLEAHKKATAAEQAIKARFGDDSIINIHMEPVNVPHP